MEIIILLMKAKQDSNHMAVIAFTNAFQTIQSIGFYFINILFTTQFCYSMMLEYCPDVVCCCW